MKKSDEKLDLEQLLAAVEKAGRDSRRREALSQMIDDLAAKEAATHRRQLWRRWSIGISAAACIALFVTTIIKLADSGVATGPLTAEVDEGIAATADTTNVVATDEMTAPRYAAPQRHSAKADDGAVSNTAMLAETIANKDANPVAEEADIAEDTLADIDAVVRQYAEQLAEVEDPANLSVEVEEHHPEEIAETPVAAATTDDNKPAPAKERRRWLQLRRAEPSKMDGTMLAFNLL